MSQIRKKVISHVFVQTGRGLVEVRVSWPDTLNHPTKKTKKAHITQALGFRLALANALSWGCSCVIMEGYALRIVQALNGFRSFVAVADARFLMWGY